MQKVNRLMILLPLFMILSISFKKEESGVKWLTIEEAGKALAKEKKPVLVDLYTDWCGWCKVMDRETYTNKEVIDYVNQKFIPVKMDAETKEKLRWNGKVYEFDEAYKTNKLALDLTQGKLMYPTTVIIPTDGSAPQPVAGFLKVKDMEMILKYFGEGYYGKVTFDAYKKKISLNWK